MSDSLGPHGLQPAMLLCPWEFPKQEYWSWLPFPSSGDLCLSFIRRKMERKVDIKLKTQRNQNQGNPQASPTYKSSHPLPAGKHSHPIPAGKCRNPLPARKHSLPLPAGKHRRKLRLMQCSRTRTPKKRQRVCFPIFLSTQVKQADGPIHESQGLEVGLPTKCRDVWFRLKTLQSVFPWKDLRKHIYFILAFTCSVSNMQGKKTPLKLH